MKKKNIESRTDAVTRDMQPESSSKERSFRFPGLGVTVKASSYQEALSKAKAAKKKQ